MPRRPRDDLQPLVRLTPHKLQSSARARFGNELGTDDELIVRKRFRPKSSDDTYFMLHDDVLDQYVGFARARNRSGENPTPFSYEIFVKLWRHVRMSKVTPADESQNLYRMTKVGCRVIHKGIVNLAQQIGVSVSSLEKQLKLYRDIGLVVNEAKALSKRFGFIEFDVMVGWRGKFEHREAYAALRTGMTIMAGC